MKISIRFKFALFSILLVFAVTGAVSFVIYQMERQRLIEGLQSKQDLQVRNFSAVCSEAYATPGGDTILISYIKVVKGGEDSDVLYAYFLDTSQSPTVIRIHSDPHFVYASMEEWVYKKPSDDLVIERSQKVIMPNQQEQVGRSVIGFDKKRYKNVLEDQLSSLTWKITLTSGAIGIIGFIISLIVSLSITRPIRVLSDGVKIIGTGNFKHNVQVRSRDEIGELAREFNHMADQLSVLDQMKDDFISSISHDLRSPLAAIKGFVDFILKGKPGPLTSSQKEYLEIVQKNTKRLGIFIDDILDLAKIQSGQMDYEKKPENIQKVAHEIVDLFKMTAEERKLNLNCSIPSNLPAVEIDSDRIHQVLSNLVSNALKFTPEGGQVSIKAKDNNGIVTMCVEDNGVGIPQDQIINIFERFKQVDRSHSSDKSKSQQAKYKGTGLGLSIVKGVIEAHDGKIWAESKDQKGTKFFFTLKKANS